MNAPNTGPRDVLADDTTAAELKQFVGDLWKRRYVVLGCAALGTLLAIGYLVRQPKVYTAAAVIEYDPSPPRPLGSEVETIEDQTEAYWASQEFYETQNRVLASRTVAERTVRRLGLHRDLKFLYGERPAGNARPVSVASAAETLRGRLKIELVRNTRLVNVRIDDTDPARAARIANGVVSSYIEKTMEDRTSSTLGALDWLTSQLGSVRGELEHSETALHDFKEQNDILSVSLEDRQELVTGQLRSLTESLTEARNQRIALAARVRALREANDADPMSAHAVAIDDNEEIRALRSQYRERDASCQALSTRYGPNHPEMAACTRQLDTLRESMRTAIRGILSTAQSALREVQSVESGLSGEIASVHQAGRQLNLRETEYQRLLRERETHAKLFGVLLDRTAETNVTRFLRVAFVRVVDEAVAPGGPSKPRKTLGTAMGGAFGLAIGLLVAVLLRTLDRTLSSADDLAQLGLSVLGVVPEVAPETSRRRRRRRDGDQGRPVGLEAVRNPRSPFAECFRLIRTSLAFLGAGRTVRTVLVASAGPGDGKTTVAVNLCASLAQNQLKVLLVDTDLRRPNVHRTLGIPNGEGVSTVLIGEQPLEAVTVRIEEGGFDVLTCGPLPPNPSELIDSDAFDRLLETALARYDRVVLDSPPVGVVADAMLLAKSCDAAMLVVRPGLTPRDLLRQSLRQLRAANAPVVGAIVNAVKNDDLTYGGSAYYYGRSNYYGKDARTEPS